MFIGSFVMAVSKPIHFEELIGIRPTSNKEVLFNSRENNVLFNFDTVCTRCGHGRLYLRRQKSVLSDGVIWRCSNELHTQKLHLM